VESGKRRIAGAEGLEIGIADPPHDVPVVAGRPWEPQRRPWRYDLQPPLRVERVGEPEEISLVRATAVVQNEQPGGLGRRGPDALDEALRRQRQRVLAPAAGWINPRQVPAARTGRP
jgi:hypothetical protein